MKPIFVAALAFLAVSLSMIPSAFAVAPSASDYHNTNGVAAGSTWTVVGSMQKSVKGIMITNTTLSPLEVGLATVGSAANSETGQMIAGSSSVPTYYPLVFSTTNRVSIRALGSTSTYGEIQMSFLFN